MLAQVRHRILRVQPVYVFPLSIRAPRSKRFTRLGLVGGGFFTGRYRSVEDQVEPGSRFDPSKFQGQVRLSSQRHRTTLIFFGPPPQGYRARYWKEPYFRALAQIEAVAEKHNLTMAEIALRWISHHSLMKREYGDTVVARYGCTVGSPRGVVHITDVICSR